jgi:8-oxo-dGTP diphosphatase
MTAIVRAAGGVVVRETGGGAEILLVHRPRYEDWTFPKGKREAGEEDERCALREVEEETGLRCALLHELPATSYTDAKGRPKIVRYWAMRVVGGELSFMHEVDRADWLAPRDAAGTLSYARDVALIDHALAGHVGDGTRSAQQTVDSAQ